MAYMLPLRFIKVSDDVVVCATRIVSIMSVKCYQARETIKAERKAGTLINACGNKQAQTAIFLDNGVIVSSPFSVRRIMTQVDKSEKTHETISRKMKVYDIDIGENEAEYESSDISAAYEESTEEDIEYDLDESDSENTETE